MDPVAKIIRLNWEEGFCSAIYHVSKMLALIKDEKQALRMLRRLYAAELRKGRNDRARILRNAAKEERC